MTPRTADTANDEFDLTRFLWGDLPLIAEQPDAEGNGRGEDLLLAETVALRETSPPWQVTLHVGQEAVAPGTAETGASDLSEPDDFATDFAIDSDIDLDALAALAELSDAGFGEDDAATEAPDNEPDAPRLDERPLSYGELTARLHNEVLPRLRALVGNKGYLTLGHLARAVVDLQASDVHLEEVRTFVEQVDAPVLPSRSHRGGRQLSLWAIRQAQQRFGELLRDQIDELVVIERFGYVGVPLSAGTRSFLVQAWMSHCLSRAEERAHASTVAAEIARVGRDAGGWSADALSAREALVLDNLWLVARMARQYMGKGVEIDDLLQFAALGLFRAVEKFDPERGYRFVTYANSWVFQAITRHIADHSRLIRLPVHLQDKGKAILEAVASLRQSLGREPRLGEIAETCAMSEDVVRAFLITGRTTSLENPLVRCAAEALVDPDNADEIIETAALAESLGAALATLTERERDVLERRFGLHDGEIQTLEEIGHIYGVTRERIRQIEDKALRRLRHPSRIKLLRAAIEPPANSVLRVPAATARAVLPEFAAEDQDIIRWLWGLAGCQQRSVKSTAKRLHVSTGRVRQVSLIVAALHRARFADPTIHPTAIKRGKKALIAIMPNRSTTAQDVHAGWMLHAADKSSADWAARLWAERAPTKPIPATRYVAD